MKKILLSILFLNALIQLQAQEASESVFRSSGKIYVVVGIIAIIFVMIVLYLIRLDKKISNLENKHK
jgi:hypothetical protein